MGPVTVGLAWRVARTTSPKVQWKFAYNFGWKGMRSVQRFKKRLKEGQVFPPFLYVSIINSCNLRCRGCWVDVAAPQKKIMHLLLKLHLSCKPKNCHFENSLCCPKQKKTHMHINAEK